MKCPGDCGKDTLDGKATCGELACVVATQGCGKCLRPTVHEAARPGLPARITRCEKTAAFITPFGPRCFECAEELVAAAMNEETVLGSRYVASMGRTPTREEVVANFRGIS